MPVDKVTMAAVCRTQGHNLASLQNEVIRDPRTADMFPQFKIICTKCGGTLEEISQDVRVRRSGKRRSNGKDAPALSSPPPPIDSASSAEDEL